MGRRRSRRVWLLTVALVILPVTQTRMHVVGADEPVPWAALHEAALAALEAGDATTALDAVDRAARRAPPNHPFVLYAQVRAYTMAARLDEAFAALSVLVDKGLAGDVLVAPAFEALREDARWPEWQERLQRLVAPVERSVVAFRLNEADFLPDAMTYDRGSRRFLIGSIRRRKIVAIDETSGRAADYATSRSSGFLGVRGLEADNQRGALFVLTAGDADVDAAATSDHGHSFLHRLQLSSGRQVNRVTAPDPATAHAFRHLVQAPDGTLYLTDAAAGRLYRWRPGTPAMERFVDVGDGLRPTGLTWASSGRALYVSHLEGLSRVDLRTREVTPVGHASNVTLVGLDGLATHGADLIGVQNGLPGVSRVVRLRLTSDGANVRTLETLDANLPDHDGPSAGVVVGDGFYYIANSQRRRWGAAGVALPTSTLKPVIRRVNLVG